MLPAAITPDYVMGLNDKPGLLALAMEKKSTRRDIDPRSWICRPIFGVSTCHFNVGAIDTSREITPDYVMGLNDKPGLLALAMEKKPNDSTGETDLSCHSA
jgi:hypothetical protein